MRQTQSQVMKRDLDECLPLVNRVWSQVAKEGERWWIVVAGSTGVLKKKKQLEMKKNKTTTTTRGGEEEERWQLGTRKLLLNTGSLRICFNCKIIETEQCISRRRRRLLFSKRRRSMTCTWGVLLHGTWRKWSSSSFCCCFKAPSNSRVIRRWMIVPVLS